jgi:hypothetical protein
LLGTTEKVLLYYLGLGFTIFLGWGVFVPLGRLDVAAARRYLRWSTVAAVVGLLHPALPLAARDIVGQVGVEQPEDDRDLDHHHTRTTAVVNTLVLLSAAPPLILLLLTLR